MVKGESLTTGFDIYDSPLGAIYITFSGKYLTGISFSRPAGIPFRKGCLPDVFCNELDAYFSGSGAVFSQKIKFVFGTDFEKNVWNALKDIPFGETRSYKWIASKIGKPGAVRAVGRALSKNPVPVVIPCHRVIESNGSLGGYSYGIETKRRLLDMEYYARMNAVQPR